METNTIQIWEVGGCVRDAILGRNSKDVDFSVVAPSFDAMRAHLVTEGFRIFVETPEHLTIRAAVPEGHPLRERTRDADFVLARKDGPHSDGRRPDFVEPGTLLDDLARRDFTMNAIARDVDGNLIDPFGGREDIARQRIRCVGKAVDRFSEDALRVLRALRFSVTLGFTLDVSILVAMEQPEVIGMMGAVSTERRREELNKMFAADTLGTLDILSHVISPDLRDAIFAGNLTLEATMRKRKG